MTAVAPFPVDPVRTRIAVLYRNKRYIADDVLPRAGVGAETFTYKSYPMEESFALVDTQVSRRGRPNEVTWSATEVSARTEDNALDDVVPINDILNAPPDQNTIDKTTENLTDLIAMRREKRAADLVFNAANYPTGWKVTLSGTSQWSDKTNSDPIANIMTAMDTALITPNIMVIGKAAWNVLRTHPKIVGAIYPGATGGIVSKLEVAEKFGLEAVYVGEARMNTAKPGQPAVIGDFWGKHCALLYIDRLATTTTGLTWGLTAQWGQRIAGTMQEPVVGMRGGVRVRVGESVKELVIADRAGYLIVDAVA